MTTTKKIFLIILVIAAAVVAGYYLYSKNANTAIAPAGDQGTTQVITIEDKKITDDTKPFEIDITYPSVEGQDGFNNFVENIVNGEIDNFKEVSLQNDAAIKEIDPESYERYPRSYYLSIGYDKGLVDESTISIVLKISNFTGGAHGANYFAPVNWDLKNNKKIELADLYADQPDYLQKISDYCIENLTAQMNDSGAIDMTNKGWIEEGAGPKEENYSTFLITENSIIFYFPQYQVAAYAAGDFKVEMPRP